MNIHRLCYIIMAVLVVPVLIVSNAYGAPKAFIENSVFDAGQVPQGKKIECDFILNNIGDEILDYTIKACCGIKVLVPGGPYIHPGESHQITVQIETLSRKGSFSKDIYLTTNDPDAATAKLSIKADVQEIIVIEPRYINFGTTRTGEIYNRTIHLINKGNDPVTITRVLAKPELMVQTTFQEEFILAPKAQRDILLTLTPDGLRQNIYGKFIVTTDLEYLPTKSIRFRAKVIPASKEISQSTQQ